MKYFSTTFALTSSDMDIVPAAVDVLQALLADIGYEAFQDESDEAMTEALALMRPYREQNPHAPFGCFSAYIQQHLFDEEALKNVASSLPFDGLHIFHSTKEMEDKNWNERWESEQEQSDICRRLGVTIDVRQAFGTGGHFTTRMIADTLTALDLSGKTVLDCGCGSGILSIIALKLGAERAVGYDIDEWSVRNTRHNAALNGIEDSRLTALLGDASILNDVSETFDIVLANINRNILLADMPQFAKHLAPGGTLILSGFYYSDAEMLVTAAAVHGLKLSDERADNDWAMLMFTS